MVKIKYRERVQGRETRQTIEDYKQYKQSIITKAVTKGLNKNVEMSDLKKEFITLGYKEVITYLNSGNVVFESDIDDKNVIKNNIQAMIKNKFLFDIPTISRKSTKDLRRVSQKISSTGWYAFRRISF